VIEVHSNLTPVKVAEEIVPSARTGPVSFGVRGTREGRPLFARKTADASSGHWLEVIPFPKLKVTLRLLSLSVTNQCNGGCIVLAVLYCAGDIMGFGFSSKCDHHHCGISE
jgi:hypothetical protein